MPLENLLTLGLDSEDKIGKLTRELSELESQIARYSSLQQFSAKTKAEKRRGAVEEELVSLTELAKTSSNTDLLETGL